VVFAISASKATPTAISERVNSALLVDCISAVGSKSTAFGALVDTDIKSIKVVLGGVGFNATNDKLILDTDITLRGDITATNKAIGTVAGLE
jgi:hypothetical protein